MSDDWKGEHLLRGIKANRGEGNGYNMPGGKKRLAARIKDRKRSLRPNKTRKGPDPTPVESVEPFDIKE